LGILGVESNRGEGIEEKERKKKSKRGGSSGGATTYGGRPPRRHISDHPLSCRKIEGEGVEIRERREN